MLSLKFKNRLRTVCGILALLILVLPADAYGARGGHGGGRGGGQMASSDRQVAAQPAERGAPARGNGPIASMPRAAPEPQRGPDFANSPARERFNAGREFTAPPMRFEGRQFGMESKAVAGGNRFDRGLNIQPSQGTPNDNRPMGNNFGNWMRTRNSGGKGKEPLTPVNRLSPSPIVRSEVPATVQSKPTPPAERNFNRGAGRSEISERWRNRITIPQRDAATSTERPQRAGADSRMRPGRTTETQTTAPTAPNAASDNRNTRSPVFGRDNDRGKFRWFGRNDRTRREDNLSRDNSTLRVVDNVPAAVTTQRTSFWQRTKNFFHRDGHHNKTIFRHRNDFVSYGQHHRHRFVSHRIVRPDFFFVTYFNFGPWYAYRPIYPYYHHRYIFVNPCGYWPYDYLYVRYYWYGCYPYYWYGYNPIPYEYGDTYNYYTYNYYGSDTTGPVTGSPPDYSTQQPAAETTADQYFDDGVKAFEAGDYNTAIAKFALARQLAPDDKVLVFAYSQAYLAVGDYKSAAQVLRAAVAKVNPADEGIFYPRGLYASDDILLKQVEELGEKTNQNPQDTDLQFLLGYQYLGLGELDKAAGPLSNATTDSLNGPPANALLQLLDKLRTTAAQTETPSEND